MRNRIRILAALAALLCALISGVTTAQRVDASWLDREVTTASFQAKTIPPPLLAGTAPYCSWTSVVTMTSVIFTWAPPAGYASTSIRITAQKGGNTAVITGATTTVSGGVYTTTIPVGLLNALGSLFGGTLVIHLATVDASSGWVSKTVDYSWSMSLAGIALSCSGAAT